MKYWIGPMQRLLLRAGVPVLMAMFLISSCTSATTGPTTPQSTGSIKIGISLPFSGDFAQDGAATKKGYQLWADTVNRSGGLLGHQVQLDIVSDASDPAKATTAYEKLITVDHVDLLLAPFGFEVVPAAQVAQRYKFPLIDGTGTTPDVFQAGLHNLFAVSLTTTQYLSSYAYFILSLPADQRPKTAAYLTANDTFTEPQVAVVRKLLEQGGVQTLGGGEIQYKDETTDFTPFAQKVIQTRAQIVVMGTLGVQDASAYIQAFKQQHYNPKSLIASAGPDQGGAFLQGVGGTRSAEGIFVPNDGWWPQSNAYQNAQFVHDYLAKYGGSPADISSDSVQAYAAGQVLQQAVNIAQSTDKAKVMKALLSGRSWQSIQGTVHFAPDGQNSIAVPYLFQWQKGQLIPVFPSSNAESNPEFPKPNWP